jgi:hypothetical protein
MACERLAAATTGAEALGAAPSIVAGTRTETLVSLSGQVKLVCV